MTTGKIVITAACAVALAGLIGCGSAANTNTAATNAANSAGSNTAAAVVAANTGGAPATPTSTAATPTETARRLFDAVKNKDKAGVKAVMSQKSLAQLEEAGKKGNKTLDEVLDKFLGEIKMPAEFLARDEKITGEKASVEVADEKGKYSSMPMIRENGAWKIALGE